MVKNKLGAAAASAPKGNPTGKYTLNGWGQTEADFAFFDLAQDKVELNQMAGAPRRSPMTRTSTNGGTSTFTTTMGRSSPACFHHKPR